MNFHLKCGRLELFVNENGLRDHEYGHGAELSCPTGWNDSCPIQTHTMSVNELRDAAYLIERALARADGGSYQERKV